MNKNTNLCILIFFLGTHCLMMGPQRTDSYVRGIQDKDPDKGGCLIPEHPDNGVYVINNNTLTPGSYAPAFNVLMAHCKKNYTPYGTTSKGISLSAYSLLSVCIDGQWLNPLPLCARTCKSISSTETETVTCKHLGETLDNCDNPVEGTVARVECIPFHETESPNDFATCHDGVWDVPVPSCLPVCGEKRLKGLHHIIEGEIAVKSDYPWHVAIYNATNDNICGGTIISHRIVLSAAHCFTDSYGKLYSISDYIIKAGKYYRAYEDSRDEGVQESLIDTIVLPERYKATVNNYEADLAILVLTKN
ncbi:hypothetical protein RI129_000645 [Pyrocoelia pectoralis]|uniref:Peptidase S1 domain-containing protein n=1 Tax=Pyrocoelia pectoralis TaxID=417401 RepID=A0AAN7VRV8_9COLE